MNINEVAPKLSLDLTIVSTGNLAPPMTKRTLTKCSKSIRPQRGRSSLGQKWVEVKRLQRSRTIHVKGGLRMICCFGPSEMNLNEAKPKLSIDSSIVHTRDVIPTKAQNARRVCPWVFISFLGRAKLRPYNYHSVMNINEVAPKLSLDLTIVNKLVCSLFRMKDSNRLGPSACRQAMRVEIK